MLKLWRVQIVMNYLVVAEDERSAIQEAEQEADVSVTGGECVSLTGRATLATDLTAGERVTIPLLDTLRSADEDKWDRRIRRLFYETEATAERIMRILSKRGK